MSNMRCPECKYEMLLTETLEYKGKGDYYHNLQRIYKCKYCKEIFITVESFIGEKYHTLKDEDF